MKGPTMPRLQIGYPTAGLRKFPATSILWIMPHYQREVRMVIHETISPQEASEEGVQSLG